MILGGLAFKASAAPFHQWTPDVYEGAPTRGDGVHGDGDQGRRAVRAHAHPDDGVRARRRRLGGSGRGALDRVDGHRQHRRARADERQAHARLQLDRAGRLPPDPDRREHAARRPGARLLPHRVRGDDARRVRRARRARARAGATGRPLRSRRARLRAAVPRRRDGVQPALAGELPADRRLPREAVPVLARRSTRARRTSR